MVPTEKNLCCCGSGLAETDCCGPLLAGVETARSAEALMRSRYSAYVKNDQVYLLKTWHLDYRPQDIDVCMSTIQWRGLTILRTELGQPGDFQGLVEFVADYVHAGHKARLREASRFLYVEGEWMYLDGERKTPNKPGRNAPCYCGSGKKYKRCCGR